MYAMSIKTIFHIGTIDVLTFGYHIFGVWRPDEHTGVIATVVVVVVATAAIAVSAVSVLTLSVAAVAVVVVVTGDGLTLRVQRESNVKVLHVGLEAVAAAVVGVVAVDFGWGSSKSLGAASLGRSKCHTEDVLHGPVEGLVGRLLEVAPRELNALSCGEDLGTVGQLGKVIDNTLGPGFVKRRE